MTCKDCIHYEACKFLGMNVDDTKLRKEFCGCFKDKGRFVELPCKVGDKVYKIEPLYYQMFTHEDDCKCATCEDFYEGGMGDPCGCNRKKPCQYISEEIADLRMIVDISQPNNFTREIALGKTAFLTREEAEKAEELRNDEC